MRRIVPIILIALLLPSFMPMANAATGRAVNIDLDVTDISITYPDSVNQSLYQMFSSNYPIVSFNKPENLYVTDGVIGVEMNINIVIENLGTTQSGFVDVDVFILHNEYTRFELLNSSSGLSAIPGSSSASIDILWTPYYAGNHTLQISVSNTNGDDDQSNNQQSRHLTIAYLYDNCVDMSQWTITGDWKVNSDAYISQSNAFHVGNGQFSTYSSSTTSTLTSPVFNVADDKNGHNAAIGYSFFYTGGAGAGDLMKGYIKDDTGVWDETFTMQNTVDNNFQDGISWQTFSATYNGKTSPLIPVDNSHFHSSTQLRFTFTSDAVGNDIGFWIDDMVIIYDQAARINEYNVDLAGVSTIGGLPGDWSITRLEVTNSGNISEKYTPTADGIPTGWSHFFSNPNGVSIGTSGIELLPGESRLIDLRVMVDDNASQGNIPVTVNFTSNLHSTVEDGVNTVIKVLPDRMPEIIIPEITPRCTPGSTCSFPVEIQNVGEATDVFSLSIEEKNVPTGWNFVFAWNQTADILVRVDTPVDIWLTATIPEGVEPDVTAEVWLTVTSSNDSRRLDIKSIEVAAAMISDAEITTEPMIQDDNLIGAGQSREVNFRIWNNASRIDIFRPQINYSEINGWVVELLNSPDLAISPDSSSTYTVRVTAPENAQANDLSPLISPKALSMRSGELVTGNAWQGFRVDSQNNLSIQLIDAPSTLKPGIPQLISVEITNNGNGPAVAIIDLPWSSETWSWWAIHDGTNVTEGVELSVSYDLDNVKQVDLWMVVPPLEAPGEFHEVTISIEPLGGLDVYSDDNSVMFEAITETIRQPRLDGVAEERTIETNSSHTFNATAWNIGNAQDSTIRARLVIQSSTSSCEVIGFLSTNNGLSKSSEEWINLNLGPTESVTLYSDIIVPEDCELNSIVSATIELEGGLDELGRPITKKVSTVLMVAERRNVVVEDIEKSVTNISPNNPHIIWINMSSTSTKSEIFDVSANLPDGWGAICDGNALHIETIRIEIDQGHLTTQKYNMRCEIIRESGSYNGNVEILINGTDDRINHRIFQSITLSKPVNEESYSSTLVYSGLGLLGVVSFALLFIRRRGNNDEEYFEDEEYVEDEMPIAGPPATAFAGPPATAFASTPSTVQPEETVMSEYEQQVAEYNRKVAEYEAWQAAQGSQPVHHTTNHE